MLVLAMQFSRSSERQCANPGHEDAGAATGWPCRRSLEDEMASGHSLKTEDRTVCPEQARSSGGNTYDRLRRLDGTEQGANWESSLLCAGTLTP